VLPIGVFGVFVGVIGLFVGAFFPVLEESEGSVVRMDDLTTEPATSTDLRTRPSRR
jgi:hypothetical protein